jgi:hypothetical protein
MIKHPQTDAFAKNHFRNKDPQQSTNLGVRSSNLFGRAIHVLSRSKHVLRRRHEIVDVRKTLFQRLHRFELGNQSALAQRLNHQTIAVTVHDRLIARQFELSGFASHETAPIQF